MNGRWLPMLTLAAATACTRTLPPCHSATSFPYDPEHSSDELVAFPDDFLTMDAPGTLTGVHVAIPPSARWTQTALPADVADVIPAMNTLDGWGTTAGIELRLTAPLQDPPSGSPASLQSDTLQLWEISDTPHRIPYETELADQNDTIILWPTVPLAPSTLHAVFMKRTEKTASGGGDVCPSSTLQQLLLGTATTPELKRLVPRHARALKASGVKAADVGAAVVFTTQSISEQSLAIEKDIAGRTYAWASPPSCAPQAQFQLCSATYHAYDYRDAAGTVTGTTPVSSYTLTARIWLPLSAPKPWPVVIFGHGLGGDTTEGDPLGAATAPMGIAAIGIDAVDHGQHPGAPMGQFPDILAFLGSNTGNLEPLVIRDNFRQSTYDKLQLLQVLLQDGDLDGDGRPDIDTSRMAYYGASLGGVMGPELLAVQDHLGLTVLSVPGGRISSIMEYAPELAFLTPLFQGNLNTADDMARYYPMLQTVLEKGDSANYGPHVLTNRYASASALIPQLMFNEVLDDQVVGNVSNHALARALNVPELPPVLIDVGIIPLLTGSSVSGDLDGGKVTAALFQYDRITESPGGSVKAATHSNVSASVEGLYQTTEFLRTWVAGGPPVIVNPYAALGTPPLGGGQ